MSEGPIGDPRGRLLFVAANPSIDRLHELDRLTVGEIHRPRSTIAVAGGKGLNAARAAATLGGTVTAVGIVGGRAGDWIIERLAELRMDARMVRTPSETRTCVSILNRATGELTEFYEPGAPIDEAAWEELEGLVRAELRLGDVAAVALSGSLPPGAPGDGYARIARLAAAASFPVPILADSYGPALHAVLPERPTVVKVNAAEAAEASGIPVSNATSAGDAAGVLLGAGAGSVVVTLGLKGVVVARAGYRSQLIPPALVGTYPVGSGDAFLGGFAVAFARGESVVGAARLGLAAGVANALIPGAGELDPSTIQGILDQIEIIST